MARQESNRGSLFNAAWHGLWIGLAIGYFTAVAVLQTYGPASQLVTLIVVMVGSLVAVLPNAILQIAKEVRRFRAASSKGADVRA